MGVKSELDKFYTKAATVDRCLVSLSKYTNISLWVEPSAGNGAFLHKLPVNRLGIDLEPNAPDILQQDFFTFNTKQRDVTGPVAVVGNPPFGRSSNLAIAFFNHAATFATVIAFIVPRTFKKQSVINKLNLNWELVHEETIPANSFYLVDGFDNSTDYNVPCVWQIWEKTAKPRVKVILPTTHKDFQFVSKTYADFAIRRVGGLAGKCFTEFDDYSESSNYFLKGSETTYKKLDSLYSLFKDTARNVAGNPSLSKAELIDIYTNN